MPLFIIECRPLRILFAIFAFSVLQGASKGNLHGIIIAVVFFGMLGWRHLWEFAGQVRYAAYAASDFCGWAWGRLLG